MEGSRARIAEIDERSAGEGFWAEADTAQRLARERGGLDAKVRDWDARRDDLGEARIFLGMASEGETEGVEEAEQRIGAAESWVREVEFRLMLSGEYDRSNAILSIHAGSGGIEAQDWAEMLLRMYMRWSERRGGLATKVVDVLYGEEAGIKSATATVEGEYAYGLLRAEVGIHRLVRISPFDQAKRRHTSFASVSVIPEIEEDVEVEIRDEDLRVDTYRSSGAGGQHVNKTDSAVRLTHLPSGLVVACQNERSQHKNKALALKILKSRLYEREVRDRRRKLDDLHGAKREIDFGSQIRSYVLQPYRLVKDHRTGREIGNVDAVLDGEIDSLIETYLLSSPKG